MTHVPCPPAAPSRLHATPAVAAPRPPGGRPWRLLLAFGVAYFVAAELGHLLKAAGAPMATLWPPSGVYVAALLLAPASRWPALAVAAFAANFASDTVLHGRDALVSVGFCAANAAEALFGAWLTRRLAGAAAEGAFHDRLRGTLALLAGAAAAGPAMGATLGAGLVHQAFGAPYGPTWALWWTGDALGVLVLAPVLIGLLGLSRPGTRALAERAAVAAAAAALTVACLALVPPDLRGTYYFILPAMAWGAVRGGSCGAAAGLAGATAAVALAAAFGIGHIGASPLGPLAELARAQGFLVVAGATCHLLAATAAERSAMLRRVDAAEARMRMAVEGAGMATFDTDHGTGRGTWSRNRFRMLGYAPPDGPEGEATTGMWRERLHPDDRRAALARLAEARRTGRPYCSVHRVVRADDGRVRWVEAHGRFLDAAGAGGASARPGRRNVGVVFDVTARVEADERERLLLREVEHRAKNALQVARSLLHVTPFADRDAFVAAVDARLGAMARAHTLLSGTRWSGAGLREVAMAELGHLAGGGAGAPPRVALRGPAGPRLRAEAAQGLAMVLHELATNAAKYGALSAPGGTVEVSWAAAPDGGIGLRWLESGGPPAGAPPARAGFGSRLIAATARGQLGGTAEFRWRREGLLVEVGIAAGGVDGLGAG